MATRLSIVTLFLITIPVIKCLIPTPAPTAAPSYSPTIDGPTASPTSSDNAIFVDKSMGSNSNSCNNKTHACLSIDYAYQCFLGLNGCDIHGNDGNGVINLGDGDWHWPVDIVYDNEQVVINGEGIYKTKLYYNDIKGIGCKYSKCWLEISNLSLATNITNNIYDALQVTAEGGTIIFNNVLFDGQYYKQNANENGNGSALWSIFKSANVTFNKCIFRNNNAFYQVYGQAIIKFVDCFFEQNIFGYDDGIGGNYNEAMFNFHGTGTQGAFNNCTFYNNTSKGRRLFGLQYESDVSLDYCSFLDSIDESSSSNFVFIIDSSIYITNCVFERNYGFENILKFGIDSIVTIERSYFADNDVFNRSLIKSTDVYIEINENTFKHNTAGRLLYIQNPNSYLPPGVNENFESCPDGTSWAQLNGNSIIDNTVDIILHTSITTIYMDGNNISNPICNDYCLYLFDTSVTTDDYTFINAGSILKETLFFHIDHLSGNSLFKSTICINTSDIYTTTQYLSFENSNDADTKLIFDCITPFSFPGPSSDVSNLEIYASLAGTYYGYSNPGQVVSESIYCFDNSSSCGIFCNDTVACFGSTFTINTPENYILCKSSFSCGNTEFIVNEPVGNILPSSMVMICEDESACTQSVVIVNSMDLFILECIDKRSCAEMEINLTNTINSTVNCH